MGYPSFSDTGETPPNIQLVPDEYDISPGGVVTSSKWSTEQLTPQFYNQYLIDTDYQSDLGVIPLPTNGSGDVLVRTHDKTTTKVVKWTAERNGDWPLLPAWDKGPNEVLIGRSVSPANPLLVGNDVYCYRVSGTYIYRVLVHGDSDDLLTGTTPAETETAAQHTVSASLFTHGII